MNRFLKLSGEEKREVFQAVSLSMGLRPDIVEKDFWVCFMLHHLFHDCKYKDAFVFKGGTSLSKAYHVIERFSEDIEELKFHINQAAELCKGDKIEKLQYEFFLSNLSDIIKKLE